MCLHSLTETSRTKIYFCSICGCISSKELLFCSLNNKSNKEVNDYPLFLISPLPLGDDKTTIAPNYANTRTLKYISLRKTEIGFLYRLVQLYQCDLSILFQSIDYLDRLYISTRCNFNIREAALICFSLSLKYNGYSIPSLIHYICQKLNKEIVDFRTKEIDCLKLLDYDLGRLSSYGVLEQIFNSGVAFQANADIYLLYSQCLNLIFGMMIDDRYLDFSQSVLAYTIITIVGKRFRSFSTEKLVLACKVNYDDLELKKCQIVLNAVIQTKSTFVSFKRKETKTKTTCSSSTSDSIENK